MSLTYFVMQLDMRTMSPQLLTSYYAKIGSIATS